MLYDAEQDPLCYRGTSVLVNLEDLRTQAMLDEFGAAMFSLRSAQPWPKGKLGVEYYRALHRHFFQDVYSWAGEFRTIRIGKGGNWFCYPEFIPQQMQALFDWAADRDWLTAHDRAQFAHDAAHFIGELNAIHPFREGNGRSQLALLSILCGTADYPFNDAALIPDRVLGAMIASFDGEMDELENLVLDIIAA